MSSSWHVELIEGWTETEIPQFESLYKVGAGRLVAMRRQSTSTAPVTTTIDAWAINGTAHPPVVSDHLTWDLPSTPPGDPGAPSDPLDEPWDFADDATGVFEQLSSDGPIVRVAGCSTYKTLTPFVAGASFGRLYTLSVSSGGVITQGPTSDIFPAVGTDWYTAQTSSDFHASDGWPLPGSQNAGDLAVIMDGTNGLYLPGGHWAGSTEGRFEQTGGKYVCPVHYGSGSITVGDPIEWRTDGQYFRPSAAIKLDSSRLLVFGWDEPYSGGPGSGGPTIAYIFNVAGGTITVGPRVDTGVDVAPGGGFGPTNTSLKLMADGRALYLQLSVNPSSPFNGILRWAYFGGDGLTPTVESGTMAPPPPQQPDQFGTQKYAFAKWEDSVWTPDMLPPYDGTSHDYAHSILRLVRNVDGSFSALSPLDDELAQGFTTDTPPFNYLAFTFRYSSGAPFGSPSVGPDGYPTVFHALEELADGPEPDTTPPPPIPGVVQVVRQVYPKRALAVVQGASGYTNKIILGAVAPVKIIIVPALCQPINNGISVGAVVGGMTALPLEDVGYAYVGVVAVSAEARVPFCPTDAPLSGDWSEIKSHPLRRPRTSG